MFFILGGYTVIAQNLVIGYTNPDEIVTLTSGSYVYDTLYILNNGLLNLSGQVDFTVNKLVGVIGNGKINVADGGFTSKGIFYMGDSAVANFSGDVTMECSIFLIGNSVVRFDSATVNIPMTYKGQYSWAAAEGAGIILDYSQCNLGAGALGGNFVDSSYFHQHNTSYISDILPMTIGIAGNSSLIVDSCSGGMEYVISGGANVGINYSDFIVVWYTFEEGDTAIYSYPQANSSVPGASDISGDYYFSDSLNGISGVDFSVHIAYANNIFWGIISKEGSSVTVNNSTMIACGFYFEGDSYNEADGFVNLQNYISFQSPFTDRLFQVNNSTVMAWNFYNDDSAVVVIDSCVFGEYVGFGSSVTKVKNSTCDGSGGYFGGTNNSKTYVYDSYITRTSGTQQIINFQDNARAWFYNTIVSGTSVVNDNSEMYFANCQYDNTPIVNANGFFAELWLDSIDNAYIDSSIEITGSIWGINGPINSSKINRYTVEYTLPDSSNPVLIKDTTATSFNILDQALSKWNTHGLAVGYYLIWLTIYVDGYPAISGNRLVYLSENQPVGENAFSGKVSIYPNPTGKFLRIKGDDIQQVKIYDVKGNEMLNAENADFINLESLQAGVYVVKVIASGRIYWDKIVVSK